MKDEKTKINNIQAATQRASKTTKPFILLLKKKTTKKNK